MKWPELLGMIAGTVIPSLTTAIVAIVRAFKADNKAQAVAQDVNAIAAASPHIDGSQLNSNTIAP
jgi:hypothetical protein